VQTYNKRSFEDIHESLINLDRFRAFLLKKRLLNFFKSRDFQSLQMKYRLRHKEQRNISKRV
jgi:hypothetical protein